MPHTNLTQLGAERLKAQPKETIFWDKTLPGFGLRVSPRGRKSFICQYRVRGPRGTAWKERQTVLGTLAFMTVGQARERAREYKRRAAEGIDPVDELKVAEQAESSKRNADSFTFARLVQRYQDEYVIHRKPSGIVQKTRLLNRWLPILGERSVADITEADILGFVNTLLKGRSDGRYEVDHLIGAIRHVFVWARKQHDPALRGVVNPAIEIARQAEPNARDRVLSHAEIAKLWAACDIVGWPGGHILKLLLLTGQRPNEVAQLRFDELSLADRIWHLPASRAKNNRAHDVHLNDLAMEILTNLPRIDGSPLIFTLNGKNAFTNFHRLKDRVHALMGEEDVPYWQIRDLRRTACTLMAEINVPHHIADKVLNHASGEISGVKAVYNRFEYLPERQQALEALGGKIGQLVGRGTDNNVIPLRA